MRAKEKDRRMALKRKVRRKKGRKKGKQNISIFALS